MKRGADLFELFAPPPERAAHRAPPLGGLRLLTARSRRCLLAFAERLAFLAYSVAR